MKWISVKDKLPELDSRVLVIDEDGEVQICNYCKSYWNNPKLKRKNGIGFLDESDEQPRTLYPAYWMPLPFPPKELEIINKATK